MMAISQIIALLCRWSRRLVCFVLKYVIVSAEFTSFLGDLFSLHLSQKYGIIFYLDFDFSLWLPFLPVLLPTLLVCWFSPWCQCCCHWMLLLFKRFGAPVTNIASAILYQHPAGATANDILCLSILVPCFLSSSSSSALNGGVVMCCHQRRSSSRQLPPFLLTLSLSPPGMLESTSVGVCLCMCVWETAYIRPWLKNAYANACKWQNILAGRGPCVYFSACVSSANAT